MSKDQTSSAATGVDRHHRDATLSETPSGDGSTAGHGDTAEDGLAADGEGTSEPAPEKSRELPGKGQRNEPHVDRVAGAD